MDGCSSCLPLTRRRVMKHGYKFRRRARKPKIDKKIRGIPRLRSVVVPFGNTKKASNHGRD